MPSLWAARILRRAVPQPPAGVSVQTVTVDDFSGTESLDLEVFQQMSANMAMAAESLAETARRVRIPPPPPPVQREQTKDEKLLAFLRSVFSDKELKRMKDGKGIYLRGSEGQKFVITRTAVLFDQDGYHYCIDPVDRTRFSMSATALADRMVQKKLWVECREDYVFRQAGRNPGHLDEYKDGCDDEYTVTTLMIFLEQHLS